MRPLAILTTLIVLVITTGCGDSARSSLYDEIYQLRDENEQLAKQVKQLEQEKEQLSERVDTLTAVGSQKRSAALPAPDRIELSKRSGIYDKDDDGTFESLVVYIRPHDKTGDPFKAPGSVQVQLWDLQAEQKDARVGQWEVTPEELKDSWAGTIMTDYYRLKLPLNFEPADDRQYTAKVTFTDYVSGKVFREQIQVEVKD